MRLELTTYRLTAGRATDCAIQELVKTKMQSVGIEPTLLRTCALSMRLNHSAKTASCERRKVEKKSRKEICRAKVARPSKTLCIHLVRASNATGVAARYPRFSSPQVPMNQPTGTE